MTPNQAANQIETVIVNANEAFSRAVTAVQNSAFGRISSILKDLETDSEGFIKQNAANRKILRKADREFESFIKRSQYQPAVAKFVGVIPVLDKINTAYFEGLDTAFIPNRLFLTQLQKQTIESINSYLLQDGFASQIQAPLNQILNQNINAGGSFSGLMDQVKTYISGNDKVDGRMLSYTRNILKDTLFEYTRSFQQSVVSDLGLVFYKYVGGLIDTSREFCRDRVDGFFHEEEIMSWAQLNWSGKNKYTTESSIFIYCGGHGCGHQLIAVATGSVPAKDLQRAKDLGFF